MPQAFLFLGIQFSVGLIIYDKGHTEFSTSLTITIHYKVFVDKKRNKTAYVLVCVLGRQKMGLNGTCRS